MAQPSRDEIIARAVFLTTSVKVDVTMAMKARLRAFIIRVNEDEIAMGTDPSTLLDPFSDEGLRIALLACAERGLDVSETEANVRATVDGRFFTYPRRRQALARAKRLTIRARRRIKGLKPGELLR